MPGLSPLSGRFYSVINMKMTKSINMALTVHRVNDLDQNLLTDQHWEVTDTILSLSNFQELPMHFFGNPEELIVRIRVWNSILPLCVIPQVLVCRTFLT